MTGGVPCVDASVADARRKVVLATGNRGKLREIQALLGDRWELVPQSEFAISLAAETGTTFTENAFLKAGHAAAASGLPAIADDSGLEVDALGGAPGLWSARYAGPGASDADNVDKLLAEMAHVPASERTARFRCVVVYVSSPADAHPIIAEGVWEGRVTSAPRGLSGFGYDPVFEDPSSGQTAAEMPATTKNARSHRGQALRQLKRLLEQAGQLAC
jgi:XTP/dITP diphosphohydrolase